MFVCVLVFLLVDVCCLCLLQIGLIDCFFVDCCLCCGRVLFCVCLLLCVWFGVCGVLYAVCCLVFAVCCLLFAGCSMLYFVCCGVVCCCVVFVFLLFFPNESSYGRHH